MKKFSIIFSLLLAVTAMNFSFAQSNAPVPATPQPTKATTVLTKAEHMPSFPGGEEELYRFLNANIKYPQEALDKKIEGTVYVTFVVDVNGIIYDVKMAKRMAYGMDQEAMRVVKMMPNWIPGHEGGRPVAVQYTLPIKFSLPNSQQK